MKILQINNLYKNKGGAEKVYFNTIKLLEKNGHHVVPFSISSPHNETSKYSNYFVNNKSLIHNKLFSFEAQKNLTKLILNEKPDIAHLHNIIGGLTYSVIQVLRKNKIPIVSTVHDFRILCPAFVFVNNNNEICDKCKNGKYYHCSLNNCSRQGRVKSLMLSAESYLRDYFIPYYTTIDSFIAVSKFVKNKLVEVHPELAEKVFINYNFSTHFSSEINFGNYFLYVGRFSREKGLLTLIEAFRRLDQLKLLLVGDGELKYQIESEKSPNVEIISYKSGSELETLIKNSRFVIASSECLETSSMATIESFALSKPVIGAQIGGIAELIESGKSGFLFEAKNISSLVRVLSKSFQIDPKEYEPLCKNAYEFALQNFLPENYYSKLQNIYDSAMEKYN